MSTPSASPCAGHATPMDRKLKTMTHRRVYGKRRADAPRAVFDQRSPVKETGESKKSQDVDPVGSLQTKLAEVTIHDEPTPQQQEPELPASPKPQVEDSRSFNKQQNSAISQKSPDTPTQQPTPKPTPKPTPEEPKQYATMVEVRIYSGKTKAATPGLQEKEEVPSTEKRRVARQKTPVPRRSSGFVHDTKANAYVRPILNEAFSPIAAQNIQRFGTWASRSANMFNVAKLAEGSYGEVYKLHLREEACRGVVSKSKMAKLRKYGDGVFKVVPLRAQRGAGSKKFTSIEEIVSEVKMLKYLDPIPGFARFREIHVVQGRFPDSFQGAWDYYKKTKDDCVNPNPSSKKAYPDSQLWAIVEMDDAGCELEKFYWSSVFQIYDIFWGVAMALARAEEYALFEHRDLHLGNVCIRSTRADGCMDPPTDLEVARHPSSSGFGISTLETTIIDYSLSRADLQLADGPDCIIENASSDLDKKQIFDAIGQDEDEVLLRNTYRHMRASLYTGNPADTEKVPDIPGIWAEYAPQTNLVWLLFLLKNLLKNRKPEVLQSPVQPQRKPLAPCSPNRLAMAKKSAKHQASKPETGDKSGSMIKELQTKDMQVRSLALKQTLEDRLQAVLGLLDIENGHEDMCCAADLVAYAMDSEWLDERDFF
ncbi:hypothetical protein NUU61_002593 [Penicillium alfredii]|uniref:Uncharacterized protein n=1 Tax=Penicillium alfredii TaxID=1506179 RepID=A0A9W9FRS2_9EURO|nr:uncharacterized protein NUU61_002593 [Penicillium alfredii]KAJ5105246.1 hypothetical protein NUU61_002593 [Penicillium alfredii]